MVYQTTSWEFKPQRIEEKFTCRKPGHILWSAPSMQSHERAHTRTRTHKRTHTDKYTYRHASTHAAKTKTFPNLYKNNFKVRGKHKANTHKKHSQFRTTSMMSMPTNGDYNWRKQNIYSAQRTWQRRKENPCWGRRLNSTNPTSPNEMSGNSQKSFSVLPGLGFFRTSVLAKTPLPRNCAEWAWDEASLKAASELPTWSLAGRLVEWFIEIETL